MVFGHITLPEYMRRRARTLIPMKALVVAEVSEQRSIHPYRPSATVPRVLRENMRRNTLSHSSLARECILFRQSHRRSPLLLVHITQSPGITDSLSHIGPFTG
jgi:hypothetical protein